MGQGLDVIEVDGVVRGGGREGGDHGGRFVVAFGWKLESNFGELLLLIMSVVVLLMLLLMLLLLLMLMFDNVVRLFGVAEVSSDFPVMVCRRLDDDVIAELENDEAGRR